MWTSETLDLLALPVGRTEQDHAAAKTQADVFTLDVVLPIIEAPTDEATVVKRLHFVAGRCYELTEQLVDQLDR